MSESEEKHLSLRVKQLIHGSLSGMRIRQSFLQLYIARTGMRIPWKAQGLGARVWEVWSEPRARAAVDCRETDRGEVREEIVMRNACGGKPCGHGSKVILLSHT